MRPYYERDGITLYCGEAREVLDTLPAHVADCVLTDPPFFMPAYHYSSRQSWVRSWADTSILSTFWRVVLDGAVPALRPTGHFLTFCNGDSYPVFYIELYRRFHFLKSLVWDKGHFGLGHVWRNQHELIIAARWDSSQFVETGDSRSDVLKFKMTPPNEREHPVQKPAALLHALIEPTAPVGGLVLDPFAGSGTTLEAARRLGRRAIGIEGEERYCEIAARRLAATVPLAFFAEEAVPAPPAPPQLALEVT